MKRPVNGIVAFVILLTAGVIVGWLNRNLLNSEASRPLNGHAARRVLLSNFKLGLPTNASNVYYFEKPIGKTRFVFARFDLPTIELPSLLDTQTDPPLPTANELKDDPAVLRLMPESPEMDADPPEPGAAPRFAWWELNKLRGQPVCAQRAGLRGSGTGHLKWRLILCVGSIDDFNSSVYIALSEEPMGASEK